ncbi:hypothetical protein [Gloeothece verrucosa]|uniref:Uncharacterized protein n=1 Tax=Gloeothece verrucosa (strain PCC 7822) TaxID=497965 RepID=E0UF86_GLOV7|nr:hypothetical protein [Gloeothece verrucosa]ADN15457.1 hypothetical protein Cyan7822_3515 [Gloeothece verrucosa PCC 7822]
MKSVKQTEQQLILTFLPISAWLACVTSLIGAILLPLPGCLFWFIPSTIINLIILFFADSVNCYFDKSKGQLIQQKIGLRGMRVKRLNLSEISGVYIEKLPIKNDYIYLIYFYVNSREKFYLTRWKYANFIGISHSAALICQFLELPLYHLVEK